jgi:hypothetical protein
VDMREFGFATGEETKEPAGAPARTGWNSLKWALLVPVLLTLAGAVAQLGYGIVVAVVLGLGTVAFVAVLLGGVWHRAGVYGGYAQPDKKKIKTGAAKEYTTKSGIRGGVATATSSGVEQKGKCATDGKATTFAFKNAKNDFVSWTFVGARDVKDEVPGVTVDKILSTVRLIDDPEAS